MNTARGLPVASPHSDPTQANGTFLARFGSTILRGGIAAIPTALYRFQGELGLTPQQVWFISVILAYKWDTDLPYPSLKKMAHTTHISERHLHNYKQQLVVAGRLRVINRRNRQGGQDTNFYDFTTLFAKLEELLRRNQHVEHGEVGLNPISAPPLNHISDKIELVNPETKQIDLDISNIRKPAHTHESARAPASDHLSDTFSDRNPGSSFRQTLDRCSPRPTAITDILAKRLTRYPGVATGESHQVIESYVSDFARELGDRAKLKASVTRAHNLYRHSGVDLGSFLGVLFQAKSRCQERNTETRNRMAYFFAVVEDILQLRDNPKQQEPKPSTAINSP